MLTRLAAKHHPQHHRFSVPLPLFLFVLLLMGALVPTATQAFTTTDTAVSVAANPADMGCAANTTFLPLVSHMAVGAPDRLGDDPPEDEYPVPSKGIVTYSGIAPNGFNNPFATTIAFHLNCAAFTDNTEYVNLFINNQLVAPEFYTLTDHTLTIDSYEPSLWTRDHAVIELDTEDTDGKFVTTAVDFWIGLHVLDVTVQDEAGNPVAGVEVVAGLGDDQSIRAVATSSANGVVRFENVPDRTIILTARAADNHYGTLAVAGSSETATLTLLGFNPPSPIDNNDFSLGTAGWEIGDAPVTLVPHEEDLTGNDRAVEGDQDLLVQTSGEGAQTISRTFEVEPGTKNVTVRYRFRTEEVPGGYYGTEWNDYFSVSLRSIRGGASAEANSMNGLGLGAFDPIGRTAWRETTLEVDEAGDTIQVDIVVANVGDDYLDSYVLIDLVLEKPFAITELVLNDIDNARLGHLSADDHTYFAGNTRINGTIKIEGKEDITVQSVEMEVLQGGAVVARGTLTPGLFGTLIQPLGSDEQVSVTTSQLLFELSSAQASLIDSSANGTVTLRVRARSTAGDVALREFGAVEILARYDDTNRYGGRDGGVGGDDWVKPDVKTIVEHFPNILVGDISNMNGGNFPPHASHNRGNDVDGWFTGFNDINAATATQIIAHLNDETYGSTITRVYVTHIREDGQPFWDAFKNVVLDDGRRARDVIRHEDGHTTHFHWVVAP